MKRFSGSLLFVLGGIAVFLVANFFLSGPFCQHFLQEGYYTNPCESSQGKYTVLVLIIVVVLILFALSSAAGREFTTGFVMSGVALGVLTLGQCTQIWFDPVISARRAMEPARLRVFIERRTSAERKRWAAAVKPMRIPPSDAMRLAGTAWRCAFGDRDGPRTDEGIEAMIKCDRRLDDVFAGLPRPFPVRYDIPRVSGRDMLDYDILEVGGDHGWRWWKTPATATGPAAIHVAPDSALGPLFPHIIADRNGMVWLIPSAGAAAIDLSPVPEMRTVIACLMRAPRNPVDLPEYELNRVAGSRRSLCPELAEYLKNDPSSANDIILTVARPLSAAGDPVPLLKYWLSASSPIANDGFVLKAVTMGPGKAFEMTRDGTVR